MLNERGHEVPDPEPVAVPVRFQAPESLEDRIKRIIQSDLSVRAQAQGFETFEEADDFDVGDDYDPSSPHELAADQEVAPLPEKKPPVKAEKPPEGDIQGGSPNSPGSPPPPVKCSNPASSRGFCFPSPGL